MSQAQTADPIPEAPADKEVDGVALAFIMAIAATDHEYRAERGPKDDWLFTCDERINLSSVLREALRRSTETDKPGVREAQAQVFTYEHSPTGDGRYVTTISNDPPPPTLWCRVTKFTPASPLTEEQPVAKFKLGDRVRKTKGSAWRGHVVGTYSTELTPEGYNVESENEPGSVQLYPAAALEALPRSTTGGAK